VRSRRPSESFPPRCIYKERDISESSGDLFEIIAATRSMRRLKPDPVPPELIRKILAALALPRCHRSPRQAGGRDILQAAWDEVVYPRYSEGDPAPGTSPEHFRRMLDAAQYLADHIPVTWP
jgi:hypothetical protein